MKIGIIGAGATGLAAAYELIKAGHEVTVLERNNELGGLAASITVQGTPIERYYHHLFASDSHIISLIKELGLEDKLTFHPASIGVFYDGKLHDFSTPADILRFEPLNLLDRLRFGTSGAYLKLLNSCQSLEQYKALDWIKRYAGAQATKIIWEPLLRGKFGDRASDISMAWLWARVHSRSFKLGYLEGGFDQVYEALADAIQDKGGEIQLSVDIAKIAQPSAKDKVTITLTNDQALLYDKVIATVPQPVFAQLIGSSTTDNLWQADYLGATCFILELEESFIPYYWLNVNDTTFPFLAVVEHTKIINKAQYGGKHVVYVGNYVSREDWRFTSDPAKILQKFIPYMRRINPHFSAKQITNWQFSKAPFAQPIVTPDYHTHIPSHETALPGVKLATMSQVYPQDRGQNYAIKMGIEVARGFLR